MNIKNIIGFFSLVVLLGACGDGGSADEDIVINGDAVAGKAIFQANCIACHQPDGKGKSGFAPSLNNIDFLAVVDNKTLKDFILEGRSGTTMMPFKNIPDVANGIDDLMAFMRSWEKEYELFEKVTLDNSWHSEGNPVKGERLFNNFCNACHGDKGVGYMAGGSGTGIGNAGFLALVSDDYLKQTMVRGRAGTAMKSFQEEKGLAHLSNEEMDDIISYLRDLK